MQTSISPTRSNEVAPISHYIPREVAVQLVRAGESLWVDLTQTPESRILALGQDFTWDLPREGRVTEGPLNPHHDVSNCALFTAHANLLVAIHDPHEPAGLSASHPGGARLGHIRYARDTHIPFGLAMDNGTLEADNPRYRHACRETNKVEHLVAGGPKFAVSYADEMVIPGTYFKIGEKEGFKYTYIVPQTAREGLLEICKQNARAMHALERGEEARLDAVAVGELHEVHIRGAVFVTIDSAGRIFGIRDEGGKRHAIYKFANGVKIALQGQVVHPELRRAMGLAPLETRLPGMSVFAAPRPAAATPAPMVSVEAAFVSGATPCATPRRMAPVERRTAPPKLEDLAREVPTIGEVADLSDADIATMAAEMVAEAAVEAEEAAEAQARESAAVAQVCEIASQAKVDLLAAETPEEVQAIVDSAKTKIHEVPAPAPVAAGEAAVDVAAKVAVATLPTPVYEGPGMPVWAMEAVPELRKLLEGKASPGTIRAEDGTLIAAAGAVMGVDEAMGVIMYHDQLAFDGEDPELFYQIKELLAAYVEVYG